MTVMLKNIRASELPEKLKQLGVEDDQRISVAVTTFTKAAEAAPRPSLDDIAKQISLRAEARGLTEEELGHLLQDA